MQMTIMIVATLLIAYSVYRGLDKGIKVVSLINAVGVLILLGFVLLFVGGLDPLRVASVVASLPLLFVYVILAFSIVVMLRED